MPDWSIKIVPSGSGQGAAFVPDIQGAKPGDPLQAEQDDLVTWNNTTKQTHQPWPTDADYNVLPDSAVTRGTPNYLCDPISAGDSSRPSYDVAQPTAPQPAMWVIFYCCKLHPTVISERGQIIATVIPSN